MPRHLRPQFPPGYLNQPKAWVKWETIVQKLTDEKHYWLCSVRPNGHPHAIPKWMVWLDEKIYFDGSPETRHARNIVVNPHVVLHLESGEQPVIVEGTCAPAGKPDPQLAVRIAHAYAAKYAALGYAPEPHQWDEGGLFVITPRTVIAWSQFTHDPTKFVLE